MEYEPFYDERDVERLTCNYEPVEDDEDEDCEPEVFEAGVGNN